MRAPRTKTADETVGSNRNGAAELHFCRMPTRQFRDHLTDTYKGDTKSLGVSPLHLLTCDPTHHGILSSSQAYQCLPQTLPELDVDDLLAVGMCRPIYGRHDNQQG